MKRANQTKKRKKLLDAIIQIMVKHELFSKTVSRKRDTESQIHKALFLKLQNELPRLLSNIYNFSKDQSQKIIRDNFLWEQNVNTTVKNFNFFATNHRPDSVLDLKNELRVAIEIKKGKSGSSLRSGIGQALVYSTQYDFVIYFFVDISSGNDIKSSDSGKKEKEFINSLWRNYNIKFNVV